MAAAILSPAHAVTTEEAVIVTATRTARTADETLASVSVITRADIERTQAKSVAELLAGEAGVDTTVNGGYGKSTSVFVRGTNSDHTLVLIDGVKVGSATLGTAPWQYLPLDQIERIEIVRGPRSSLYGSEAIGGVIQIFTRRPTEKFQGQAEVGYGTYGTSKLSAGVSGADGNTRYNLTASHFNTDGIDAKTASASNEGDRDGYRNESFGARLMHRFAGGAEIELHTLHAQAHTEFDGITENQTAFLQDVVSARLNFAPTNDWSVKLQAGTSRDYTDNFKNGGFVSTINTLRNIASWQNDVTLTKDQLLTLGADYQDDRVGSTTAYTRTERADTGVFLQHQGKFGNHDVLVGLRRDDNEQFGIHNTGNLAWGYALSPRLRARLSYGAAFKAPTFNQLYFPGFGDPNLRPERSKTYEAGLRGRQGWGSWNVSTFQTNIENLIATVTVSGVSTAQNVDKALIKGLETEVSTKLADWETRAALTLLDPRDTGRDTILNRRAKRNLKLTAERADGKWRYGANLLVQGHRYDNVSNTTRLGGYGIVNFQTQYDLSKQWVVRANLDNAFDKTYETISTFKSPGRAFFVSLGYRTP
ncbi:MAG: TonB-dependent vitamin B12 receptor [Gammaproteobacteria bacterium]|nr:TonB-dependent vitamin B12 receptor [Gammaproteobacteria bacterium]